MAKEDKDHPTRRGLERFQEFMLQCLDLGCNKKDLDTRSAEGRGQMSFTKKELKVLNELSKEAKERKRGLYGKFIVYRIDGSSANGKKHEHCDYFVLDLVHDKFAVAALKAYTKACKIEYPLLARDLEKKIKEGTAND